MRPHQVTLIVLLASAGCEVDTSPQSTALSTVDSDGTGGTGDDAAEADSTTGDGDGDSTTGDGDGTSGDGDGTSGDGDGTSGDGDGTSGDGDGTSGDGDGTSGDGDGTSGDGDGTSGDGDGTTGDGDGTTGDGDGTSGDGDGCLDLDNDGWTTCEGDCCDVEFQGCVGDPSLVNPGAFDLVGNGLDDDCDGDIDESSACDMALLSDTQDPLDYARAIDLCQFTTENPSDPTDRTWGVISGSISMPDGIGVPHLEGHSVRPDFGTVIVPELGSSLAVLSSGTAADANDTSPNYSPPQSGVNFGTASASPADWLAANSGTFPNPAGCPDPWHTDADDAQMFSVRVRVPTNARSFSVKMNFLSAEYPEWVCSSFNDFFVALVDSTSTMNPADKNIATYDDGATLWPMGVNLVLVADGLYNECENGEVGCRGGSLTSNYTGCTSSASLAGTGFDGSGAICPNGNNGAVGGGTGWLTMSGNVEAGETIDLRFAIWDTSGFIYDSTVLLDAFEWSVDTALPGISPQ